MSETQPLPNPGEEFATTLESATDDPVRSLYLMESRLGIAVGGVLNLGVNFDEQAKAATLNRGSILKLTQAVILLSRNSTVVPHRLGEWLNSPNDDLWQADERLKPLEVIWTDALRKRSQRTGRTLEAAVSQRIVNHTPETEEAIRALLGD